MKEGIVLERPNIFRYANRELSQDAMICWLLACLHSSQAAYRALGLNFIRFLFDDSTIQDDEVALEPQSPHKQFYRMDVYAVVGVRNTLYPLIFENKTNTYLHSGQFFNYCSMVADWLSPKDPYLDNLSKTMALSSAKWGEIVYVYFKTGYPFGWQKQDFQREKETVTTALAQRNITLTTKEIYLETMVDFLESQNKDPLLNDYFEVLAAQKRHREYVFAHGLESVASCNAALDDQIGSSEAGCALLFQTIFSEDSYFHYDHQHWASKDLLTITDKNNNQTYYSFRFQWCSYDKTQGAYAFQLQQWRREKAVCGDAGQALSAKVHEANRIQALCQSIVNDMGCTNVEWRFETLKDYPCKSYDRQMLFKVFIVNNSTPSCVCDFIKRFSALFRQKVLAEFGENVQITD